MFISAFLAGSILPFSSEVVMVGLIAAGSPVVEVVACGTLGNIAGGLLNFYIGRLGKEEWIQRFSKIPPAKLEKGKKYVHRYGAWAGLLAWVPVVGDLITVAMGYLRTNVWLSVLTISLCKYLRYQILVSAYLATLG